MPFECVILAGRLAQKIKRLAKLAGESEPEFIANLLARRKSARKVPRQQGDQRKTVAKLPLATASVRLKAPREQVQTVPPPIPRIKPAQPIKGIVPAVVPRTSAPSSSVVPFVQIVRPLATAAPKPKSELTERLANWREKAPEHASTEKTETARKSSIVDSVATVAEQCTSHMSSASSGSGKLRLNEIVHQVGCSEPGCAEIIEVNPSTFELLVDARRKGRGRPKCEKHGGYAHLLPLESKAG